MTASLRAPSPAVLAVLAVLVGLTLGVACRISNEDHCVHKAIDSDAWCAEQDAGKPFCSPCEAVDHGCVAARPDDEDCPAYTPDSTGSTASSSTGESG